MLNFTRTTFPLYFIVLHAFNINGTLFVKITSQVILVDGFSGTYVTEYLMGEKERGKILKLDSRSQSRKGISMVESVIDSQRN